MQLIKPPLVRKDVKHVFHQYTIKFDGVKRDKLIKFLNDNGIGTGIHYPKPIYQQELYQKLGYYYSCPEAEKAADEVISIPVHPGLNLNDLEIIVKTLDRASKTIL